LADASVCVKKFEWTKKKKLNEPTDACCPAIYALLSVVTAPTVRQTPFHGPRNKTRWKHKKRFCETTQPPPPIYYYGARMMGTRVQSGFLYFFSPCQTVPVDTMTRHYHNNNIMRYIILYGV